MVLLIPLVQLFKRTLGFYQAFRELQTDENISKGNIFYFSIDFIRNFFTGIYSKLAKKIIDMYILI
jgi:hypothetical protein